MLKGYCCGKGGYHTLQVELGDERAAFDYMMLQKGLQYGVKIIDSEDYIVMETREGRGVFPPELVKLLEKVEG